jgi:hypothetical protein
MPKSMKKAAKDNSVSIPSDKRKNKHHSYMKLTQNEETGVVTVNGTDGEDFFYMGTHDLDLINNTINQVCNICSRGEEFSGSSTTLANAALASILEIDPQDSVELMLATQMTTVHNMSLEMSRRVMLSEQTFAGVDANINRATKLMRTFTAQIEALNKYRNKGKQQITVKHQNVNVNDGGQAVIGDVNQGGGNG